MLRAFLWIVIAALVGAIALLLFWGEASDSPVGEGSVDTRTPLVSGSTPVPESPTEPAQKPVSTPDTASDEQIKLRKLILSGNYAAPAPPTKDRNPPADVVILKRGGKLRGKVVSEKVDAIMFQVDGKTEVRRIARKDILRISTALAEAARSASRGGERAVKLPSDEELRMSPEEYKKHQIKKRTDKIERARNKGGIRSINMARELKEEIENKNRGIETIRKKE